MKEVLPMRKMIVLLLALILTLSCSVVFANEPIKITMLKSAGGNDSQIELWRSIAEQFAEWSGGKYVLEMEEIPGVAVDVRTKYKMLNAANNLPTIVTDMAAEPAFADLLIKNNRVIDLAPFFNESPEWQAFCLDASIAFNTEDDGKMWTTPGNSTDYTGIYYNTELFAQAGIEKFPETWDEFWAACDALKAIGVAPVALHTTETGWCAMLLATGYAASLGEEHVAFLNEYFPSDYNNDTMMAIAECLQKLFSYTTSDAVGGTYSLASNNFCAGKAAMIANGPWMAQSFYDISYAPEGFSDKVAYAPYPCGIMMSNGGASRGLAVSTDVPKEEQLAAIEFLKFLATPEVINQFNLATGTMSEKAPLSDEQKATLLPILQSYADCIEKINFTIPSYQSKWDSVVQTEVIEQELPNLAMGNITAEEFITKMTEGAQRYLAQTAN
jgi:raffinose/stachyose/melibiose transport system substrate-binding protein